MCSAGKCAFKCAAPGSAHSLRQRHEDAEHGRRAGRLFAGALAAEKCGGFENTGGSLRLELTYRSWDFRTSLLVAGTAACYGPASTQFYEGNPAHTNAGSPLPEL